MNENNRKQARLLIVVVILLILSGGLYLVSRSWDRANDGQLSGQDGSLAEISPADDEQREVEDVVAQFGGRLKDVSLLSPTAPEEIEENYRSLVAPALIAQWKANPSQAPGRLTSSPWPDEIIVESIEPQLDGTYEVSGRIVEKASSGTTGEQDIALTVSPEGDGWLISKVELAERGENDNKVVYTNSEYGFAFELPASWTGYSVVMAQWQGEALDEQGQTSDYEEGPIVTIRHPRWASSTPRQDIPVMVFTSQQWDDLNADKFHIGAAPVGPRQLGRNQDYVFALPARYNFAFPEGYQEVEDIIEGNPLTPIEN